MLSSLKGRASRDLRTGGAWSPLQRLKNDAIFGLAVAALATVRALPRRAVRALGRALGVTAHLLARRARTTALANVARVYPELGEGERRKFVRRAFTTLGEFLADAVLLLRSPTDSDPLLELTPEAREVIDDALREGHGVVFASAHLGPWERVAASLVAAGLPFATLARESYDPRFTRLYERLRSARGVRVVWRGRATPGSVSASPSAGSSTSSSETALVATIGIMRTLRGGGVLGVPMDLRSRVPSCAAPFLGHPALTPVGPARIALRSGAAVIVGTAAPDTRTCRTDRTSGTHPEAPAARLVITATRIPTEGIDALELTARINGELSARIRDLPHAWVWMHERWTAPAAYDDRLVPESL